jgi:hypothetical protein
MRPLRAVKETGQRWVLCDAGNRMMMAMERMEVLEGPWTATQ